jgi:hypothetical protein
MLYSVLFNDPLYYADQFRVPPLPDIMVGTSIHHSSTFMVPLIPFGFPYHVTIVTTK